MARTAHAGSCCRMVTVATIRLAADEPGCDVRRPPTRTWARDGVDPESRWVANVLGSPDADHIPLTTSRPPLPTAPTMDDNPTAEQELQHLRILIANERSERLEIVARVVVEMGHTVIARELDIDEVGQVTREERPDVALVGLGESSQHALDHISRIVREATSP